MAKPISMILLSRSNYKFCYQKFKYQDIDAIKRPYFFTLGYQQNILNSEWNNMQGVSTTNNRKTP